MDIKSSIAVIGIILTVVGYIPYLKDTLSGKTLPHVYTWFIWATVTAIAYALQVSAGAGPGSWITLAVVCVSYLIFILGFKSGKKQIARIDTVFFVLALIALGLWLIARQPVLSIILVATVDMLGFVPTIRKSWNKPYTETLFSYELNTIRHGLSLFALEQYSIVTWLYPLSWTIANGIFSIILILRRKAVPK